MTLKSKSPTTYPIILLAVLLALTGVANAAGTPDRVNYQGVLRDIDDIPLSGSNDLVFRAFAAVWVEVEVNGEVIWMKDGGGDGDQRINFFDSGVMANEYVLWDDTEVNGNLILAVHARVGVAGTTPCKVDASFGAVLAKALEPLDSGSGTIQVLVWGR